MPYKCCLFTKCITLRLHFLFVVQTAINPEAFAFHKVSYVRFYDKQVLVHVYEFPGINTDAYCEQSGQTAYRCHRRLMLCVRLLN